MRRETVAATTVRAPGLEIRMSLRSSTLAAAICVLAGAGPAAAADPPVDRPEGQARRRAALRNLITPRLVSQVPRVAAEPPVRPYVKRPAT